MNVTQSGRGAEIAERLKAFMVVEDLKPLARKAGLWNVFLPAHEQGDLTNLEYAPPCAPRSKSSGSAGRSRNGPSRQNASRGAHLD